MQTQTHTLTNNHTALSALHPFARPPLPRFRPRLTRGVAEIWEALTPTQRAEVDAVGKCVNTVLAENPRAAMPDCGAITIWLCERLGVIWNFETGSWEWEAGNA